MNLGVPVFVGTHNYSITSFTSLDERGANLSRHLRGCAKTSRAQSSGGANDGTEPTA